MKPKKYLRKEMKAFIKDARDTYDAIGKPFETGWLAAALTGAELATELRDDMPELVRVLSDQASRARAAHEADRTDYLKGYRLASAALVGIASEASTHGQYGPLGGKTGKDFTGMFGG